MMNLRCLKTRSHEIVFGTAAAISTADRRHSIDLDMECVGLIMLCAGLGCQVNTVLDFLKPHFPERLFRRD
jgi:hypothetical protein